MAQDIKMVYNSDLMEYDVKINGSDLLREEGIETAVFMSLFTDRRAEVDDPLLNNGERKGWWGDALETNGDKIGSRLWLLNNKTTVETIQLAKYYIEEALQWLIDDRVVMKMEVNVERQGIIGNYILAAEIKMFYSDGANDALKFIDLWNSQVGV